MCGARCASTRPAASSRACAARSIDPSFACIGRSASTASTRSIHAGSDAIHWRLRRTAALARGAAPAAHVSRLSHSCRWSRSVIESSPKRSESDATTTRPAVGDAVMTRAGCAGSALGDWCGRRSPGRGVAAVTAVQGAGAVEAGLGHLRGEVVPGSANEVRQDPGGHVLVGVGGVLHGDVVDGDAEPQREVGEVVAVLGLLGLGEDHQASSVADEALDRVELVRRSGGGARAGRVLPGVVGGVRQHEHVDAGQGVVIDRAVRVHARWRGRSALAAVAASRTRRRPG